MHAPRIQRAILSVSDKEGLAEFAAALAGRGVEIYSTGGTRRHLEEHGVEAREISAYTGFPEVMSGRLKTLHPKVFGGILYRRDRADDVAELERHGIVGFELVVVNLYPFAATVARPGVTREEAVEQIDIGGPSLIRAAAKNHAHVTVAVHPRQYAGILDEIAEHGGTSLELRRRLMAEAFAHTAEYDSMIAEYFSRQLPATSESSTEPFPEELRLALRRIDVLRYGENPHQRAALYADAVAAAPGGSLVTAKQLAGKELSYNNLLDLDSALALARSLSDAATVVIKHNNPCGAASALTLAEATNNALEGDPLSAFGSILGMNRPVDMATAERLAAPGLFIEAIVAPGFAPEALELLTTRPKWHKSVRLMQVDSLDLSPGQRSYRFIEGGLLVQDADVDPDPIDQWRVVTQAAPTDAQYDDLRFAWAVVRHVKSNAIVLAQGRAVCGVGAGQMSRVDSVDIAVTKAGDRARGSVMASDAFFPFADSIDKAQAAGVAAVVQPGGSRGDDQVIEACNRHGLSMVFTGRRHFKH